MESKYIIFVAVAALTLISCTKEIRENDSDFNVECINTALQPATTFKVGDTVSFRFTGNPDRISFFSGEMGRRYEYRDRITDSSTRTVFNFKSALNTAGTSGTLKLLVSTDFAGYKQNNALDAAAVTTAVWTDISSRATWASGAAPTASGSISLADYAVQNKPVHLAFRYEADEAVTQAKWTLSDMSVRHHIADTSYLIDSTNFILPVNFPAWAVSPGWGSINQANPLIRFVLYSGTTATTALSSVAGTTSFVITGEGSAANAVATQNWIVTGPLDLRKVLPDAGIPIKEMSENAMQMSKGFYASLNANYTYKFTRPGTYNVVFLASSDTKDNQSTVARIIPVVVN